MEFDAYDVITRIQKIYSVCSAEEQAVLTQILEELSIDGTSKTYNEIWLADYKEIPVDIETFMCSELYLGKTNRQGKAVYPFWMNTLRDIFSAGNKYEELVFTGATRIGKSSTAIAGLAYMLYKLMCLKDPQTYYNKKEVSKFAILFFNITKDLAKGVAFREFNDSLRASPWFNEHGTFSKSDRDFYYIPEGGKVVIEYGSSGAHGLGMQIYAAMMDECNFSQAGVKDVNKAKQRMKDTYNTISARVKGTFRKDGQVHGKIFSVSSKKSDSDFLETYVEEQIRAGAGDHIYVAQGPQWDILPPGTFSEQRFWVAVGNRHQRGFVIPENQSDPAALADVQAQGFTLINPPIDMLSDFTADFDIALRDLAGISVPGALSFITQEAITACINPTRRNPFFSEVISVGTKDNMSIIELYHDEVVPAEYKRYPLFIHIDLSKNTDRTGLSGVCICGRTTMDGPDGKSISMLLLGHVFSVAIEAPRGDKIPYAKITEFICWLRRQGYNISRISRDQFQSEYMAQLLEAQDFTVDNLSLDRTPDGYQAFRSMLLEQRIDLLDYKLVQDELICLQRDALSGKIDHPVGGCFTGDTMILLADGYKVAIEDIANEWPDTQSEVFTVNEDTLNVEVKRIAKAFKTKMTDKLVEIVLSTEDLIRCTPEHRFMIHEGTYVEAKHLKTYQRLRALSCYDDDHPILVQSVRKIHLDIAVPVYDLSIEDNPNFLLAAGIFVHNSKDVSDSLAGAAWNATLHNPGIPIPTRTVASAIASVNGPKRGIYSSLNGRSNSLPMFPDPRRR